MTEDNGTNGRQDTADNGRDPKTGQFVKGNPGGPGRPAGTLNFMTLCRRVAREAGLDSEGLIEAVIKSLFRSAIEGETGAAKVLLDRACGPVDKMPEIQVGIDNRTVTIEGARPQAWLQRMAEVLADAQQRGLIDGGEHERAD